MVFRKKGKAGVLEKEPYATFIKKFDKLTSITNEKIHMRITSGEKGKNFGLTEGFSLDYCYAKMFDLKFEFYKFVEEECIQNLKFCVMHSISYKFEDEEDFHSIMMDTIDDIQKRNGFFYISSLVKECEVKCSVNNKSKVTVTYAVFCEEENAKEVCLQLISHDIAMFTRSF